MPLTPNGKADRKALMREKITIQSIKEYVAPRDEMEKALATIFQELLHIEKVGIYDNFFELGGHSLLATQLVSKIRAELGVELSLKSIFGLSTLEELARTLHQREKVESKIRIKSSKEEYIELFEDSQDDEIEEFIL
jgi:acyl carrier protein